MERGGGTAGGATGAVAEVWRRMSAVAERPARPRGRWQRRSAAAEVMAAGRTGMDVTLLCLTCATDKGVLCDFGLGRN